MVSEARTTLSPAKGSKGESNHPDDVSSAMLIQGILFEKRCATILAMRDGSYYQFWIYIRPNPSGLQHSSAGAEEREKGGDGRRNERQ